VPFDPSTLLRAGCAQDRGVDHGGLDVLVAEEFLDGANVVVLTLSCDSTGGGWRHFDRLSASADLVEQFLRNWFHLLPPVGLTFPVLAL
jgi:hypothetical protein